MTSNKVLRIISFNLENGGVDAGSPTRWYDALEFLKAQQPDIVLMQEMRPNTERVAEVEPRLGMACVMAPNGRRAHRTAVMVRRESFDSLGDAFAHDWPWRLAPTDVTVTIPEAPGIDLTLVSFHTAFNSPGQRRLEAEELTSLVDKLKQGRCLIMAGDANELPVPGPGDIHHIDWSKVTDLAHRRHRAARLPDGGFESHTYFDELLLDCGMHDAARYAALRLGQHGALAATAGHAPSAAGQGGACRVDRFYVDPWLATTINEVEVLDTSGLSDHHAVQVSLDRKGVVAALRRTVQPEPGTVSPAV